MSEVDVFDLIKKRDFKALIKAVENDSHFAQLRGVFGTTILHQSAEVASPEIIKCLVDLGCNIHALDDDNQTPIWYAIDNSNHEVVDYLLEQGASLDVMNKSGLFPLQEATISNGIRDIDFLLSRGVPIDQKAKYGCTALHYAAISADLNLIGFLIDNGANVNEQDNNGYSPLHYVVLANKSSHQIPQYLQAIELLIKSGTDIYAKSKDGKMAEDFARGQIADSLAQYRHNTH